MSETNETLKELRELLLGDLYDKCKQDAKGVSRKELEEQVQKLQDLGCIGTCTVENLVAMCKLDTYNPDCISAEQLDACGIGCSSTCSICLEPFSSSNKAVRVCKNNTRKHCFHQECIDSWMNKRRDCPVCRGPLLEQFDDGRRPQMDIERRWEDSLEANIELDRDSDADDFLELVRDDSQRNTLLDMFLSMYPMTEPQKQDMILNPLLNEQEQNKIRTLLKISDLAYALNNQGVSERKAAILSYSPFTSVQKTLTQDDYFSNDQRRKIQEILNMLDFQRRMGVI